MTTCQARRNVFTHAALWLWRKSDFYTSLLTQATCVYQRRNWAFGYHELDMVETSENPHTQKHITNRLYLSSEEGKQPFGACGLMSVKHISDSRMVQKC